ncbi:hypothetical protein JCGZ_14216 [Jatropha curcas]|uniref:ATP synthase delta chain n=1 Tax=Jatropha curcas TaxID=180498 RepID=A0A067K835_JATCU|nr:ATP synthase delta chain, chloroplastic [Jatropha curcas]KDP28445.1 hypothetical protein JCGZ_14216 [Jatropha curcas]
MDAITSVSSLKVPAFNSAPREFHHVKTFSTYHQLSPHVPNSSISNKSTAQAPYLKTLDSPHSSASRSSSLKPSPSSHRNPASGYAAALLDIAQRNNSLEIVQKDVQRCSKLIQNKQIQAILINPLVDEQQKGQLVMEVAKNGKVSRLLMRLLKILIDSNRIMMVNEVLMEFERIFDELSGTKVVLISSKKKMAEDTLFRIAQSVQKLSGAVKVKVRNLVDGKLPSFAV